MRVVQFVREESKHPFGVKVGKAQPVRGGAVGSDEEWKKVFDTLDGQVADQFLVGRGKPRARFSERAREPPAAQAHMRPVVGQADVRGVGEHDQVVHDDPGLAELSQRIELAPAQDLVTEMHILLLGFSLIPSGEAGAHEQVPIEGVRDAVVQLPLVHRRMRGEVDHGPLPVGRQLELEIGVHGQKLCEEKALGGLAGHGAPHPPVSAERGDIEGLNFGGRVIVREAMEELPPDLLDDREKASVRPQEVGQRELHQIADRDANPFFAPVGEEEAGDIRALALDGAGLVCQEILPQRLPRAAIQDPLGEPDPAILPHAVRVLIEIPLQLPGALAWDDSRRAPL